MKNQLRRTIGAYVLAAVVPLGAYAEQEDYFNQSAHDSEDPYRLFCADRPLIFSIPIPIPLDNELVLHFFEKF